LSESDTLARRASHVVLQPAGWPQPKGYANGIKARGEMVFVGGMIGWDEHERFPPDFVGQTRQLLKNIVAVLAEGGATPQHIVRKELVGDRRWRPELRRELLEQPRAVRAARTREDGQRALVAVERIELADQLGDRGVPGDRLELPVAPRSRSFQRLRDAIRMIRQLDRRLPARAERPLVDRVRRESFELLRDRKANDAVLPVSRRVDVGRHDPHRQPAAAAAQRAHAGTPFGDAGRELFFRQEPDDLMLRVPAARERGRAAADGGQLDEGSAVHQK